MTSEYGLAVSEKRIKRFLKDDAMAAQLLELAASPPRPATPPGQEEGFELAVKAGHVWPKDVKVKWIAGKGDSSVLLLLSSQKHYFCGPF